MIYRRDIIFGMLILWILSAPGLYAAGTVGTSGAAFLEYGVGSRPLGMGEAFTAETEDFNSIYYNPAGLGSLRYPILGLFHHELIMDSRLENISFCYPIKTYGFIALSNTIFWTPSFDKIDINGLNVGEIDFYNGCLAVAYGHDFNYLYLGASLKYIYQKIDTKLVHAFAADIGILKGFGIWAPFEAPLRNFHVGLSVLNLGTDVLKSPLPRHLRIGLSYKPSKWMGINVDLIENCIKANDLIDFTHGFNESFRVNLGLELNYLEIIYIRGGWRFNDVGTYTVGIGFNYVIKNVSFSIDASFADAGNFKPTYSFNVAFKLIPKATTLEDRRTAEKHYRDGVKYFINDNFDSSLEEFKKAKDFDPYLKGIDKKINDVEELRKLKKENIMEEEKDEAKRRLYKKKVDKKGGEDEK
jgi:hypothetical protein